MKRDFLKNLGIEEKEIIDKILDENSSDIGRAKGELDNYKTQVTELQNQISEKEKEISGLKVSADKVNELTEKVTQLEADKTKLTSDLENQVTGLQKTHAIESGIRDAKAKNIKAVMALLDMEKITFKDNALEGLTEQIENLQKDEGSSFLFGEGTSAPSGTKLNTPPSNAGVTPPTSVSFTDAIAKALNSNK